MLLMGCQKKFISRSANCADPDEIAYESSLHKYQRANRVISKPTTLFIGPDNVNCNYFLTHQFKQEFWMLKRTVSLRQFF